MAESLSPAALLKRRWGEDWLLGAESQQFWQVVTARSRQLTQLQPSVPQVLLIEADPVLFLAGFIAACGHRAVLFLGDPNWQAQEWSQVAQQVSPDLIWGSAPVSCRSAPLATTTAVPPVICIPTGGSSGQIKFAVHTWKTLLAAVEGFQQHFQIVTVNAYCTLPLHHVSGLMQALRTFVSGGKLVLQAFKQLEQGCLMLTNPENFFISLVPTQLQRLLHPGLANWLSRFQAVLLGGAPAWPELLAQAKQYQTPLALTYGMTETAAQITTLLPQEFLAGNHSSGRPLPHAQVKILAPSGESLSAGQIGQVTIQVRSLCLGYYASPSVQLSHTPAFQPDDLGWLDAEGYLHIVGRQSQKIITGGENVFPEEVEAAIRQTGWVQDVCVVGLADRHWGQVVTAVYVPTKTEITGKKLEQRSRLCSVLTSILNAG